MVQPFIPNEIANRLDDGAALVISVSGGKDSDAMLRSLVSARLYYGWQGGIYAVHADLGRAEWQATLPHIQRVTASLDVPLHVVYHTYGDLLDGIRRRMATRPDAPPFPSSAARWCTSDWKRSVIDRWIRQTFTGDCTVICAMGIRAEESKGRAAKPMTAIRAGASAPQKRREVIDWLPIHKWTLADVWEELGYTLTELQAIQSETRQTGTPPASFNAHPAYAHGNQRLSCAMCVLASVNDLLNGAHYQPETYRELCQIEIDSGFSFRNGFWLGSLRPDLLTDAQRAWYEQREASVWAVDTTPRQLELCW